MLIFGYTDPREKHNYKLINFVEFVLDGNPLIGKIPGYAGAFIATGHSCWGILNGPATGECLAQMIQGQELSVNLDRLSPQRFLRRK